MNHPKIKLLHHPEAPLMSRRDGRLRFKQILEEVKGGNFPTNNEEFREHFRQAGLVSLYFFLRGIASYTGPYALLSPTLHVDMANFYQDQMIGGSKAGGFIGRSHFKDLYTETPILTTEGWSTHRGLSPGDYVFSPDGKPVKVEAVTETFTTSDTYKIIFQDKSEIICGIGHEWKIWSKHRRGKFGEKPVIEFLPHIVETGELKVGDNVSTMTSPIEFEEKYLPIDPYVFGAWLGDGTSANSNITQAYSDYEVIQNIIDRGYVVTKREAGSSDTTGLYKIGETKRGQRFGFSHELHKLGVKNNKHIPEIYLQGSVKQRWDLLRGLMDTDGTSHNSTATFVNMNKKLTEGVYDLANSLGLRARFREHTGKNHNGKYTFYHVSFQHYADRQPFSLKRKADKASTYYLKRHVRKIAKIEKLEGYKTNCIQVEGGMYLAGKELIPTHNSTIWTHGANTWEIVRNPELHIGLACGKKERAEEFLLNSQDTIINNPLFAWLYPEYVPANPRQLPGWNDSMLTLPNKKYNKRKPNILPMTAGGSTAGIHVDLLKLDDIIGDDDLDSNRASSASMYKMRGWLKSSIRTLVMDWTTSRVFLSATRYAIDDAYEDLFASRCKEQVGYWDELPYEVNPKGEWSLYYRMMKERGKIIFPENFTEEGLEQLQEDDYWTYITQYFNNPHAAGTSELSQYKVKECNLDSDYRGKFVSYMDHSEREWKKRYLDECDLIQVCDPAASEKGVSAKTSRSAHIVYAAAPDGKRFIIEGHADYVTPKKIKTWMFSAWERYKRDGMRKSGLEMQGPFKVFAPLFRDWQNEEKVWINLVPIKTQGDKDARIRTKLENVLMHDGVYCVPSFRTLLMEELRVFPDGKKKDILDAWSMAEQEIIQPDEMLSDEEYELEEALEAQKTNRVTGY